MSFAAEGDARRPLSPRAEERTRQLPSSADCLRQPEHSQTYDAKRNLSERRTVSRLVVLPAEEICEAGGIGQEQEHKGSLFADNILRLNACW